MCSGDELQWLERPTDHEAQEGFTLGDLTGGGATPTRGGLKLDSNASKSQFGPVWGRSWTFWSLPFILDLLHERFVATSKPGKIKALIARWSQSARSGTFGQRSTSA